jgi:hypothetical protein
MPRSTSKSAALGFTIKSGWAAAVLLAGPSRSPDVLDARKIDLSDPAIPDARQPYHAGFGTARGSGRELSRLVASVERFGRRTVTDFIVRHQAAGLQLRGAGIIVGSLVDPGSIGNDHIRIHALEGQLFRRVVQEALADLALPCCVWRERDLGAAAVQILKKPEGEVRGALTASAGRSKDRGGPNRKRPRLLLGSSSPNAIHNRMSA